VVEQCKVYRFRLQPSLREARALNRDAGARRWIWNWGLARRREHCNTTGNKERIELK
jgi:putative transposase